MKKSIAEILEETKDKRKQALERILNAEPYMFFCKVCQDKYAADIAVHGPGVGGFDLSCGHRVIFTKEIERYTRKDEQAVEFPAEND